MYTIRSVNNVGLIQQYVLLCFYYYRNKNRVIYNKERTKVLNWGDTYYKNETEDDIHVENFRDELYSIFKKENYKWDKDDRFLLQAVSDFIHCAIKAAMESHRTEITTMDAIHYAFVVPSVWDEDIAKTMIRSVFIQSNLISKEDHNDRLLFFTDIESIFYGFNEINHQGYSFKRGQNTILSRLSLFENSAVSVDLDLISTMNTRFNFDDSKLFPKVVRSMSLVFTFEGIKDGIKSFFETKLFPDGMTADQDRVMDMVAAFKFDIGRGFDTVSSSLFEINDTMLTVNNRIAMINLNMTNTHFMKMMKMKKMKKMIIT